MSAAPIRGEPKDAVAFAAARGATWSIAEELIARLVAHA
jgi:hypothetical protein